MKHSHAIVCRDSKGKFINPDFIARNYKALRIIRNIIELAAIVFIAFMAYNMGFEDGAKSVKKNIQVPIDEQIMQLFTLGGQA